MDDGASYNYIVTLWLWRGDGLREHEGGCGYSHGLAITVGMAVAVKLILF